MSKTRRSRRSPRCAQLKAIDHNVLMHIKKDVRHTGTGWKPLLLDPAWDASLKRLLKDGDVVDRPDLGGFVPKEFEAKLSLANAQVLAYVKHRTGVTGKALKVRKLARPRALALGRLVQAGQVKFDPKSDGYSLN